MTLEHFYRQSVHPCRTGESWRRALAAPLVALLFALADSIVAAQSAEAPPQAPERPAVADPHPLRPPDTSSPRDTLQNFLTSTEELIADQQGMDPKQWAEPRNGPQRRVLRNAAG